MKSIIKSVSNLRNYDGFKTSLGTIKSGSLFRGGHLGDMNDLEINRFAHELNIKQNIDFRTTSERNEFSDPVINGIRNIHLNVLGDNFFTNANPDEMAEKAKELDSMTMMLNLYSAFPVLETPRDAYINFFDYIANGEGSLYFHCTAGKDRTGFGGALLLKLLGASDQMVMDDYMLSNAYRLADIENEAKRMILLQPDLTYEKAYYHAKNFHGVQEAYLLKTQEIIDQKYGGVELFLENQLKVTPEKREKIRERFLK